MISIINKKNNAFEIKNISDKSFEKYGKILDINLFRDSVEYLSGLDIPKEGNKYIAHDKVFEIVLQNVKMYDDVFGFVKLQFGYVNGHNEYLNALEYHKSSEINISATPFVLFLGDYRDIENNTYNSEKLEAFYIPENTVIEIYSGVLHFSPCKVRESGFICGVILPYGTNQEFVVRNYELPVENQLLFKTNKWLLSHYLNETLVEKGAYPGLQGENYKIKY